MESAVIRQKFLDFFAARGHTVVPGSSLVPDEPSLLLTTAGMVQFIPYFRGERKPEHTRLATVQRCLRTTDIDKIGHTARHLTFFEMLGNFSVGDYYKQDVIPWAWEFVTKELGIDPERLWVSVFLDDDEAFDIWHKDVGVAEHRIVRLGEDENFWSMGPTGPCGPCSEIHYDFGEDKACGPDCAVGCECDRFLEIWNLVFMQYNRDASGELHPLPKKNIDTGMGLERVASVLQNVTTNFETDVLKSLIEEVATLSDTKYNQDARTDISLKIVADHARAVTFMINDGILPSNEGRGYVLRRLLRRAVRHGRMLGIEGAFLPELTQTVIDLMSPSYDDVGKNAQFIKEIVKDEEDRFRNTLKAGLGMLDGFLDDAETAGSEAVDAETAFKLYDTYGFPLELTVEIAAERGLSVDEKGFSELAERSKQMAKNAAETERGGGDANIYAGILDATAKTEFCGYGETTAETVITAIVSKGVPAQEASAGDEVEVFVAQTPFYAEMGGQVGDSGTIKTESGAVKISDAFPPLPGLTAHRGRVSEGTIRVGQAATAAIDNDRRAAIRRNHTATHLLHWALRIVLGEHVRQGGSHVDEQRLRFDFTHGNRLSTEETARVEMMVNKKILENYPVRAYTTTYKYATESGALAFFGEKYGKNVRVLEIGDFSRELCGGTHVARSGDIGQVRITSEASVGANLRRIEAVTGLGALNLAYKNESYLSALEKRLKTSRAGLPERVEHLLGEQKTLEQEMNILKSRLGSSDAAALIEGGAALGKAKLIAAVLPDKSAEELRAVIDDIRNREEAVAVVLGSAQTEGANLIVALSQSLASADLNAVEIIRLAAKSIKGGGGGRPDLAQAGGRDAAGLPDAVETARKEIARRLA
jgi:alanyl-tRNA synthetase